MNHNLVSNWNEIRGIYELNLGTKEQIHLSLCDRQAVRGLHKTSLSGLPISELNGVKKK